jgi:hypothetical protein
MVSTKRLTEDEIANRLVNRPIELIKGTFKNIRENANWKCLSNPSHGIFSAPPRQIIHANGNCPKCGKVAKLTEELIEERLVNRPIQLIKGTLKGSDVHAKWRCLADTTHPIWHASPSSILNALSGCPVCSGKLLLSEKEIEKRLIGKKIALVSGSYIPKTKKAKWHCLTNESHQDWVALVGSVLYQNTGCPECAGNVALTEKIVKKRLGTRPIALVDGSLKGARGKSKWRCLINQEHPEWSATADSVLGGTNCPVCTGHEKLSISVVMRRIQDRPIKLVSKKIEGSDKKVTWGCLINKNHENWKATVGSVLAGSGCPECSGNAKLSEEKIIKRLKGRLIEIEKGTFKSSQSYAKWNCLAGKNHPSWMAVVNSVLSGVGCPACAEYGYKENKSAYIYILILGDLQNPIGIKCGITNNDPKFRHGQINRKTTEQVTLVKQWFHSSGKLIRELEKKIITKFKHNDLKKLLKDGGTETYYYHDFDKMVKFIDMSIKTTDF